MQILDSLDNFSDELGGNSFIESALALQSRVNLTFRGKFKDQVERIVIFVMIVKFDNIPILQLVHDFDLQFDLLNQVMLYDLGFVDDFDGIDVFRDFVAHFVNFAKAANADI